jgi:glycerol-3-phosphate dehydrogenase (NAD(P)+)
VLLTRAVAEASRLGEAVGASARTFFGLAGLGNLLVRQSAEPRSAEFEYGVELARGDRSRTRLPEGARAAHAGVRLANKVGVYLPVLQAIAGVLDGRLEAPEAAAAAGDTVAMEE